MIERSTSPSKVERGKLVVRIVGDSLEEVLGEIAALEMREGWTFSSNDFTSPVRTSDHRWAVQGRVKI